MSGTQQTARRPLLAVVVFTLVIAILVAGLLAWQEVRWWFAAPLAVAFEDHDSDTAGADVYHSELRKLTDRNLAEAGEIARSAGFECRRVPVRGNTILCYRDVWTRLCKSIWSLQMFPGEDNKVAEVSGRKRRVCLFD